MSAESGSVPTVPDASRLDDPPAAAPLAMGADEFRRTGYALVDLVAAFLDALPGRPVTTGESPNAIRALLGAGQSLPSRGTDPGELLQTTARLLFDHSLFNGHPRFFGYIRACIVNFHTGKKDVDALPGIVVRLGKEVDAELRRAPVGSA